MPWYEYRAVTAGGSVVVGQIEAEQRAAAADALLAMRLDIRDLDESAAPPPAMRDLSADDLSFFNEQLATMADAGIALDEGLAQLAHDVESPRLRRWIEALVGDLRGGRTLEQAIAAHEAHLPLLYSRVIRAGVRTGNLPTTLLNLNEHLRITGRTRRILWELLSYPILVALLGLTIVSLFFTFVVPKFAEIFVDFDTNLPTLTQLTIDLARMFPQILLVLAVLVAMIVLTWRSLRYTPRGRRARERLAGTLPLVGDVQRTSLIARFLRAVATAVGTGVPLPEALRLGAGATGGELLRGEAEELALAAERGDSLVTAAQNVRFIPQLFAFCVQSARSRNALPAALGKLANAYEQRSEQAQLLLHSTMLPIVIVFLGGFIGLAVIAMFLPLVKLVSSMTG